MTPQPVPPRDGGTTKVPPHVRAGLRTRLRAFAGTSVALALLVAVTATLAAAHPRAVDRYGDAGLRRAVEQALPDRTTVQMQVPLPWMDSVAEMEAALRAGPLDKARAEILATAEAPLVPDPAQSSYGVRTTVPMEASDDWLPQPGGRPAQLVLAAQQELASHSRLSAGRLPRTTGAPVTAATARVEAAVTVETARTLDIRVGSVIHLPGSARAPLAVRITGIVAPRTPEGAYWSALPVLRTPALSRRPDLPPTEVHWLGGLLLAADAGPVLLGTPGRPQRYWNLAPDVDALRGHDLGRLASAVAALESGPGVQRLRTVVDDGLEAETNLDAVLADHARLRSGLDPLLLLAAVGTGSLAVIVLAMAGGVAADRRRAELALLRARGASLPGLALRLLAETAVVAVPAGALGLTAALLALPGARTGPAVAAALAVTLFACVALPLRAVAAHRTVRLQDGREDLAATRPSRRRTVAELTVVVIAAGAVAALRRQGSGGTALVAAAPLLTGVVAALLLARLHPLPLRVLSRAATRMRGLVVPLSLAQVARAPGFAVLPLLALLSALTTAAFGGSVLAGVTAARDRAALLDVGADGRVETTTGELPRALPDRIRRLPGVRDATEASVAYDAKPQQGSQAVPLAAVDPDAYARLARRTDLGPFDAARLRRTDAGTTDAGTTGGGTTDAGTTGGGTTGSADRPLPALASPRVADEYGTGPYTVLLPDGTSVTVRVVQVLDRTPAVSGDDFLIVDRAGLPRGARRTTTLLLTGDALNGRELRSATHGTAATVRLRAEERARDADSPLQSGAERLYGVAVAAGAGYAVLALVLTVLRTAPDRGALLARLRTMGMTRSQGRRLLILTALPQAFLAAAGGVLTGWVAIRLLAPGVDLTAIALASPSGEDAVLRTDPLSLALPALAVLLLAVGVPAGQAWWSGRRGSVRELRLGDT
ncbi:MULTISPECIES: FtsX-like permease family protein [Streptomyces]|uniref:ABC transporter permease n=1 Tax=Streptomyces caniscabiei TaxID=2746961 RepID=A0ABU4MNA4_9ACTN|nr:MULTISPECIES: FtsX-like permease family protein [Streptomyces]MDX2944128.1 ABC transporter permease [Streptomyces caniscabiei]MDX2953685.1 ABC transporter permease [Streptomyces caniscabiei]MDX2987485.1 ABC transporter permease [Streptomyces caniscabiei]MDX3010453.1 ABC transporter permease [Streptomyces caniscabiei]MDX3038279.1 ABC transporter permease [Streptomyces caniscabiei]